MRPRAHLYLLFLLHVMVLVELVADGRIPAAAASSGLGRDVASHFHGRDSYPFGLGKPSHLAFRLQMDRNIPHAKPLCAHRLCDCRCGDHGCSYQAGECTTAPDRIQGVLTYELCLSISVRKRDARRSWGTT